MNFLTTQRTLSFFRSVFEIKQLNNTASPICLLIDVDNGSGRVTKILFYAYDSSVADDTQITIPENIFVYKTIKSDVMAGGWILLTTETLQFDANLRFLDLIDTPNSYSGFANYFLRVKSTQDGIEFVPGIGYSASIVVVDTVNDLVNLDTSNLVDYTLAYVKENYTLYLLRRDVVIPDNLTLTENDVNLIGQGRVVWYNLLNPTIYIHSDATNDGSGLFYNDPTTNTNIIINKNINKLTIFRLGRFTTIHIDINNNSTSFVSVNELNIFSDDVNYFKIRNKLKIKNLNTFSSYGIYLYLEDVEIERFYCPINGYVEIGGNYVIINKFDATFKAYLKVVDGLNIRPLFSSQEMKNVYIVENDMSITPIISTFHFYYDDGNDIIDLSNPDNLDYIYFYSDIRGEIPFRVKNSDTSYYPHPKLSRFFQPSYRKKAKLAGLYGVGEFQYEIKHTLLAIEERIRKDKNLDNSCFVILGDEGFWITPIIKQIYTHTFHLNAPIVNNADDYYYLVDDTSQYTILVPQSIFDDNRIFVIELLIKYIGYDFEITDTYNNITYNLPSSSSLRDYSIFRYRVDDDNTTIFPLQKFYTLLIGPSRITAYIKEITINAIAYL